MVEVSSHSDDIPRRVGIFAWFGLPVPFPERMRLIRDAGFAATCLWWEEKDPARRRLRGRAPALVRDAGLFLDNIHVPYDGCNGLWSGDQATRCAAIEQHSGWIEDCARYDIPVMVMHVTQGNYPPPARDVGVESLRHLTRRAEDNGVTLAVENTRSWPHINLLLEEIDSPCLGLCYDNSHDWLYSGAPLEGLRRWRRRVVTSHLSDTDGVLDRHWLPGEGVADIAAAARVLARQGNGTPVMLEVVPKDRGDAPEQFLKRAFVAAQGLV